MPEHTTINLDEEEEKMQLDSDSENEDKNMEKTRDLKPYKFSGKNYSFDIR